MRKLLPVIATLLIAACGEFSEIEKDYSAASSEEVPYARVDCEIQNQCGPIRRPTATPTSTPTTDPTPPPPTPTPMNTATPLPTATPSPTPIPPTPTPVPTIYAATDIQLCVGPGNTCNPPPPGYTSQGGTVYNGLDHRILQRKQTVQPGSLYISDVKATYEAAFAGQPTPPTGFTWRGSSCEGQSGNLYLECFNLFAKYSLFNGPGTYSKLVNSKYCVSLDGFENPYCQGAPPALEPPSQIYRPTPTGDSICVGDFFAPFCHDLFIERKTFTLP